VNETKPTSRLNRWLWREVERYQRLPRRQRVARTILWVVLVVGVLYVWGSMWDCPIC
jgi:hypothetical protein